MLEMGTSGLMSGVGRREDAFRVSTRARPRLYHFLARVDTWKSAKIFDVFRHLLRLALYQGTTSVVPYSAQTGLGFKALIILGLHGTTKSRAQLTLRS
jgi:hypothetical protein